MSLFKDKKRVIIIIICFLIVLWSQRDVWNVSTGMGFRVLEFLYTFCMTFTLTNILIYLLFEKGEMVQNHYLLCYLGLLLLQIIAFLPMYTQNFLYGDDLWGFTTAFNGNVSSGLYFERPFISFLMGLLPETSFRTIQNFRILNGLFLLGFGCVLFRFVALKTKNIYLAFLFSVLAIASCTAVDCIAYASIFPINASLMISAISFVLYDEATETIGGNKALLLTGSGVCLFTAFCLYQIGTPIVFLFYMIAEKYSDDKKERKRFSQAFLYLLYYGTVAVSYLFINKILQMITGITSGQSARGKIINSFDLICNKLRWFLETVCPQSITRLTGNICGSIFFNENNMFYQCTFTKHNIGTILTVLITGIVIFSIVATAYEKKSCIYVVIGLAAIPLSFYPFLVLPESTFLTYYAMAIILLFLWYVMDGVRTIVSLVQGKKGRLKISERSRNGIVGITVLIVALQSNNYSENAWVNYCRDSYEYLANYISAELEAQDNINTILVEGTISPYVGGRDYVIFCLEDILIELGKSPSDYHLVQSDNGYYLISFPDNELTEMEEKLGQQGLEQVLKYYIHDDMYGRMYYNGMIQEREEMEFLRECFMKTGQLVMKDEKTIVISMNGFNRRNPF